MHLQTIVQPKWNELLSYQASILFNPKGRFITVVENLPERTIAFICILEGFCCSGWSTFQWDIFHYVRNKIERRNFSHLTSFPSPHYSFFRLWQQNSIPARPLGRFTASFFAIPSFFQFFLLVFSIFLPCNQKLFCASFPYLDWDFHFCRNLRDLEIIELSFLLVLFITPISLLSRFSGLVSFPFWYLLCLLFLFCSFGSSLFYRIKMTFF